MKTILCYGDSNTWGYIPQAEPSLISQRYGRTERWPGVLRQRLGDGYWVIEEGLSGRTTVWDDPIEGLHKNGKSYLLPCLESHRPLDLVALMLGTNDLKPRFPVAAFDIAAGAGVLVEMILTSQAGPDNAAPQVLLICPPPVAPLPPAPDQSIFAGSEAVSRQLPRYYQQIAELYDCAFLDAGQHIASSDIDGVHLESAAHRILGERVAEAVQGMVGA